MRNVIIPQIIGNFGNITGTEIIEPTETPKEGDIIESNSRMFENMVKV